MDNNDSSSGQYLLGKRPAPARSPWFSDVADIFVLLCSSLFITASIILVILIFHAQATTSMPTSTMSTLQRAISALSTPITSAVILVAGRRYVLYNFTTGGIRTQRVAVYSSPSIGNLAFYSVWHGFELLVLVFMAVWALGLATALTVNDTWVMAPVVYRTTPVTIPYGPFNTSMTKESFLVQAGSQLAYVMGLLCSVTAGGGLIQIGGDLQLTSGGPMGVMYYPAIPYFFRYASFSFSTALNSFNISMEEITSIPPTAENLTCASGQLWYAGGDNNTLSMITPGTERTYYQLNASAIVIGGTLQSTGNATEFVPNGTSWLNVMPDDQWARDIVSLVCNTTQPVDSGICTEQDDLCGVAMLLNPSTESTLSNVSATDESCWSTALGMAMGAYSSAWWQEIGVTQYVPTVVDHSNLRFTAYYGIYVLITNIVASIAMLVMVVRLRVASPLGGDFINATRLLLDPLKNPDLFNATLDASVNALGDPYMSVSADNEFLLSQESSKMKRRGARRRHKVVSRG